MKSKNQYVDDVSEMLEESNAKRKRPTLSRKRELPNKKKKSDLYKLPTTEELNELNEAYATFHSGLFHMQAQELLEEMKFKMKKSKELLLWLKKFQSFLSAIPESETFSVNDLSWINNQVKFPIKHSKITKGIFKFLPPTNVQVVGSFAIETICAAEPIVDIAVEIPKMFWQQMDFVNHRYHMKRALYLTYIAQSLLTENFIDDLNFCYEQNCYLKPVLIIRPKGNLGKHFKISVNPYPEKGSFKLNRFIPVRNNVRSLWFFKTEDGSDTPTPHYNSTILIDLLLPDINDYLREAISSQNVKDGIILVKLWSIRRGLFTGYGRLSGFIIAMFVAYLVKKRKINPLMSSYQVFRCVLLSFQNEDLIHNGITLCEEIHKNQPSLIDFHQMHDVVFIDSSGFLNICYNITKETFSMVQHESKLGIKMLDESLDNNFSLLFTQEIIFSRKFEYLLHLSGPKHFKKYCNQLKLGEKVLDHGEDIIACIVPRICDILRKGLKTRILLLDVKTTTSSQWSVSELPPSPNKGQITIGILLNPDVPLTNLEKGPSAEDPMAKEFQDFWGDMSEMRRFQDGTICEAVLWPAETIDDKRKVFCTMIMDILVRHIGVSITAAHVFGTEINFLLGVPKYLTPFESVSYGTGEEQHVTLSHSFSNLTKQLRNLKGLPLLIASIQGTSPVFRFSETFPPLSVLHPVNNCGVGNVEKLNDDVPPYVHAMKAIINLEGSGKWPDDAEAIKRVKCAFYIKIAELLKSQASVIAVPFESYIDISKDGFIFRFEIACRKEISLLKHIKLPNGFTRLHDTKESQVLECLTQVLPKLNSILHGVHQQHNTYGTACRLAKRWLSSQLLYDYFHNATVELIMAHIYVSPDPYTCPSSPQVAFMRFLSLCHTHDWETLPLVVNLNNQFLKSDIEEIHSTFTSRRPTLPPMTIATPLDKSGAMWTRKKPSVVILRRLITLAKASIETLEKQLCSIDKSDFKEIFRPPFNPYDVIIHLKSACVPMRCLAVDYLCVASQEQKSYRHKKNEKFPVVEHNPVELYVKELRANFGQHALFFYDVYGGDFIAIAFKPSSFEPREFKMSHANCCTVTSMTSESIAHVVPDMNAMLQDFEILGSGLVSWIQKLTDNCTKS